MFMQSKKRRLVDARSMLAYVLVKKLGYTFEETASVVQRDGMKKMKVTQIRENLDEYMNKYKEIHDFVISNQDQCVFKNDTKKHISMNIGMELHKRSRKKLFDTLEQYIENFWD